MSKARVADGRAQHECTSEFSRRWPSKRLSYCVQRSDVKVEPEEIEDSPYVGLEHVVPHAGRLIGLDDKTPDGTANVFDAGDVLFGKLRPYLAKAVRPGFGGICSTEFLVLHPAEFTPEYLLYVLLSDEFVSAVDSTTYGAKMPRANWEFIGNIRVLVPPRNEQIAIADYLGREIARIDELISKQELLIERLDEYRTALITQVVTRGGPDKRMCISNQRLRVGGTHRARSHGDCCERHPCLARRGSLCRLLGGASRLS